MKDTYGDTKLAKLCTAHRHKMSNSGWNMKYSQTPFQWATLLMRQYTVSALTMTSAVNVTIQMLFEIGDILERDIAVFFQNREIHWLLTTKAFLMDPQLHIPVNSLRCPWVLCWFIAVWARLALSRLVRRLHNYVHKGWIYLLKVVSRYIVFSFWSETKQTEFRLQ